MKRRTGYRTRYHLFFVPVISHASPLRTRSLAIHDRDRDAGHHTNLVFSLFDKLILYFFLFHFTYFVFIAIFSFDNAILISFSRRRDRRQEGTKKGIKNAINFQSTFISSNRLSLVPLPLNGTGGISIYFYKRILYRAPRVIPDIRKHVCEQIK